MIRHMAGFSNTKTLEEKVGGIGETVNKTLDSVEEVKTDIRGIKTRLTSIETKLSDLPTKDDLKNFLSRG